MKHVKIAICQYQLLEREFHGCMLTTNELTCYSFLDTNLQMSKSNFSVQYSLSLKTKKTKTVVKDNLLKNVTKLLKNSLAFS